MVLVLVVVPYPWRGHLAIPAFVGLITSTCIWAVAIKRRAGPQVIAAVVVLASVSVAALAATIHASALVQEPLASWARARLDVIVDGVVTTEPLTRVTPQAAVWQDRSITQAGFATTRVACAQGVVDVQVPLTLRVKEGVQLPSPGTIVIAHGRLISSTSSSVAGLLIVDTIQVRAGPGFLDALTHAMRSGLQSALVHVPEAPGALVAGLAIGHDEALPPETAQAMKAAGLSHLTAVSGGNVAVVLGLVLGLAGLARLSLRWRVLLGLSALVGFVVLVGPQPSVLRSAVMGGVIVVSLLTGGRRSGPSVLAVAVVVLVVVSPDIAVTWGFTLSVLATAGLILLSPTMEDLLERWQVTRQWPHRLRQGIALTCAAQAATLPALAAMGAFAGWASLPANLLAEPVVAPITVLGLLAAVVAPWWAGAATGLVWIAAIPARWLVWIAHTSLQLPFASVGWPTGIAGVMLCVAIVLFIVVARTAHRRWQPRRRWWFAITCVAVAGLIVALGGRRDWPPPDWFLIMCDVGQGDAIILRAAEHEGVLVDAGPDPSRVDRCLHDAGITRLPAIVLTHFHADHVNGLPGALHDRSIGTVLVTPVRDPTMNAHDVDSWTRGIPVSTVTAGDMRIVGDVSWRAVWPAEVPRTGSVPNNASIVLDAVVAGERVLLTGDVEHEVQSDVLPYLHPFDVVKVPHHGSGNAVAELARKAPAPIALISVGADNPYGHPAQKTVDSWTQAGTMVLRTDLSGDIAVVHSPEGLSAVTRG